jgi:hypothetical protein
LLILARSMNSRLALQHNKNSMWTLHFPTTNLGLLTMDSGNWDTAATVLESIMASNSKRKVSSVSASTWTQVPWPLL